MERKKPWLCPECGSDNIYHERVALHEDPEGRGATTDWFQHTFGINTESVSVNVYVCGDCGAVRMFVLDKEWLQKITGKWAKLNE